MTLLRVRKLQDTAKCPTTPPVAASPIRTNLSSRCDAYHCWPQPDVKKTTSVVWGLDAKRTKLSFALLRHPAWVRV
ncbi:hypothetical protein DSO57_1009307 [Entomophthora muscae]|uniref:Uncharacterized protein n=1 Tax=Entomophthora muscae TaxID=34485 RepID=A0ACC2RLL7_9FUNG|nr:hypothetical protein DSO57_1009307 [Entomophthora muscae]